MKKLLPLILAVLLLSGCAGGSTGTDLRYLDGAITAEVRIERGELTCTALLELGAKASDGTRSLERVSFIAPASLEGIVAERSGGELRVRLRDLTVTGEAGAAAESLLVAASLFSSGGRLVSVRRVPCPDAPETKLTEMTLSDGEGEGKGERTLTLNADGGLRSLSAEGITVTVVWLERGGSRTRAQGKLS